MLEISVFLVGLTIITIILIAISGLQEKDYMPMSYDEEMDWLMNVHGLSKKEADEYASIRTFSK